MGRAGRNICPSVQPHDWCSCKACTACMCALFIKQRLGLADEETVEQIRENAYMQFFLGFAGYSSKAPFDPSMMVHLRKRFLEVDLNRINGLIAERGQALVLEAALSLPADDSDDPKAGSGEQISLDDFVKPAASVLSTPVFLVRCSVSAGWSVANEV